MIGLDAVTSYSKRDSTKIIHSFLVLYQLKTHLGGNGQSYLTYMERKIPAQSRTSSRWIWYMSEHEKHKRRQTTSERSESLKPYHCKVSWWRRPWNLHYTHRWNPSWCSDIARSRTRPSSSLHCSYIRRYLKQLKEPQSMVADLPRIFRTLVIIPSPLHVIPGPLQHTCSYFAENNERFINPQKNCF